MDSLIDALCTAYQLKDEKRTGWELRGIDNPEDVASHSWGTAYLCLLFGDKADINVGHAIKIAVIHDLAESITGDQPYRVDGEHQENKDDKQVDERNAIDTLLTGDLDSHVKELWEEYEARATPEARFVKDMDLIDMAVQALVYEEENRYNPDADNPQFTEYDHLDEFMVSARNRIQTDIAEELFATIYRRYQNAKN